MKLISANKLNRLWNNGVVAKMVAKTKILKTLEEIEANTNEENVAGATALKEVNNKLASGRVELVITDGKLGYKLDGADTVIPFFNAIYITVNWQINILCNGTSFNHNMGSYRLKITRSGVTKISGQLPNLSVAHIYNPDNITVQSMHLSYTNITVE